MAYVGNTPLTAAFLTDTFSGNGSTVAFTMSVAPANTSSILVAVTGVTQDPSTYSVSGTTLTFSAAPPTGTSNISVRYLGIPASGVTTTAYRTQTEFTATAGQTTFSVPSYTAGFIDVYRNGLLLGSPDFTATNGTTVVLTSAASAGDFVETVSFYVSSVLNAIPATASSVSSTYLVDSSVTTAKIADANVTQAKLGTNVAGNGPAFSYYPSSNQSITTNTFTKILFQTSEFDTSGGMYSSSRFTPTIAGYYQVQVSMAPNTSTTATQTAIYKNGSLLKRTFSNTTNAIQEVTALIYLNGSTDYIEGWGYLTGTSPIIQANIDQTYFQASMVRGA